MLLFSGLLNTVATNIRLEFQKAKLYNLLTCALITDLSRAFHCLDHELIIAKLNLYGFTWVALKLYHDYPSHKKQRTRITIYEVNRLQWCLGYLKGQYWFKQFYLIFLVALFFILSRIDVVNFAIEIHFTFLVKMWMMSLDP